MKVRFNELLNIKNLKVEDIGEGFSVSRRRSESRGKYEFKGFEMSMLK